MAILVGKIPVFLQQAIYDDIIAAFNNKQDITTEDLVDKYRAEFEKRGLREIDMHKIINKLKKWRYRKPAHIKDEFNQQKIICKQQEIIDNNNKVIEKQKSELTKLDKKKDNSINQQLIAEKKARAYEVSLYAQKRVVELYSHLKVIDFNGEKKLILDENRKYDGFDLFFSSLLIKGIQENQNMNARPETARLIADFLKDNEKMSILLQQNNNTINTNNIANYTEMMKSITESIPEAIYDKNNK